MAAVPCSTGTTARSSDDKEKNKGKKTHIYGESFDTGNDSSNLFSWGTGVGLSRPHLRSNTNIIVIVTYMYAE